MVPRATETSRPTTAENDDANLDPISGAPGAHPIGVGAGAAGGGVTGAAIGGAVAGPIGAGVGAIVGAVAGGLAGKGAAEVVNPTVEHDYWRSEFSKRPYVARGSNYETYAPAYQYGWENYTNHADKRRSFDVMEADLRAGWERRSDEKMKWSDAREATRDAWLRMEACNRDNCAEDESR